MRELLNLEPTNLCNFRCPYCGDDQTRKKGMLEIKNIPIIMEKIPLVKKVKLYLSGEPLLHPRIDEIINVVKNYTPEVVINTNGSMLTRELNERLICSGLDVLRVSLHEGYVLENVKQFIKQNKGKVKVIIQTLWKYGDPDPREALADIGADVVEAEKLHDWAKTGSVDGAWPVSRGASSALVLGKCYSLNYSINICWNGDVVPCCRDLNGELVVGNILKEPWMAIEARLEELAKMQEERKSIGLCDKCEIYQAMKGGDNNE